ncbi:hypothetical protein EMPS_04001 [Entomortierella parvispora]|uniref:G domain-containing protein n=1 Tax=Entomortierella parvispora TaxID=205924 RepID=A0A9P3LUZ2_9FUNG|nr:hypothetical protein EMPS_04001 [Entomortierella parvispora]
MLPSSHKARLVSGPAAAVLRGFFPRSHCCARSLATAAPTTTRSAHIPTRVPRPLFPSPSSVVRFSTCTLLRKSLDNTLSSSTPASSSPTSQQSDSRNLKALVGLPCPGCGSPFQVDRPQEPGFLARADDFGASSTLSSSKQSKKSTSATSMNQAQYEEHLKSLDPKLREELMGIVPPSASILTDKDITSKTTTTAESQGAMSVEEPVELLDRKPTLEPKTPPRLICHRCHSLSHHASPLANSSVLPSSLFPSPPAPVPKHLETLAQSKSATVVLVVDLIDFPLSLPQPIIDELLKAKKKPTTRVQGSVYPTTPIILVGNKFDVMPLGTRKHRVIATLQEYLQRHGLDSNVRAIHLVSAKNPVGDEIRLLLKSIGTSWSRSGKGNVVMVGAENVGKSQLMNAFLKESGRWKPKQSQDSKDRNQSEQTDRQKKLEKLLGKTSGSTENKDDDWSKLTGVKDHGAVLDQYEELYKSRSTEKLDLYKTTVSNVPGTTLERIKVPLNVLSRFMGATPKEVQTKWLMDTPGIRTTGTMIGPDGRKVTGVGPLTSWLTLEELKVSLPKRMLKPASFMLEEGKSFFLGGLVRIDCISIGRPSGSSTATTTSENSGEESTQGEIKTPRARGSNPAPKLTCFTTLPLHKTSTVAADRFLERSRAGELTILQPPFGTPERLAAFPGLRPAFEKDVVIINNPLEGLGTGTGASTMTAKGHFSLLDSMEDDSTLEEEDSQTRHKRKNAELQLAGQYGICDLVFSGIGWIMVSGKFRPSVVSSSSSALGGMKSRDVVVDDGAVVLRVWTPMGQGAAVRDVCLLPELATNLVDKTAGGIRQKQKIFQPLEHRPSSNGAVNSSADNSHHDTTTTV